MSLTFNMVGGGGGGGLLPTDAVLRVQAPAQSTVTISKGTTTKTDLGHENAADNTVYDYYFIIHQSQFDSVSPWTVTATLGVKVSSDTIIINAADEYDMTLQPLVPEGYQAVEYIANTNQQWINFEVAPEVVFKLKLFAATSNLTDEGLFGVDGITSAGSNGYRAEIMMSNSHYALYARGDSAASTVPINHAVTVNELVDIEYEQSSGSQKLTIYGITVTADETTVKRNSCGLFSYFNGASTRYYHKGRARHAEIYNNGVLVRDMWACYRRSDSVAGMYDLVSESFFTNAGSGTFTVGSDII